MTKKKSRKQTIYVACSTHLFESRLYQNRLMRIRADYPEAFILEPKKYFIDTAHWLQYWDDVIKRLHMLIFFVDRNNFIGKGTYKEIVDCMKAHIPVFLLTPNGSYISLEHIQFTKGNESNWRYYSRIFIKRRKQSA